MKSWRRRRRPTDSACAVCLSFLLAAGAAPAQDVAPDSSLLERFVAEVGDMTAGFEQTQTDADGNPLDETATGRFSLLRPDRFRWQQETPFEQIFVADGESLWTYDVELEQVTRAPLSDLAASPALLLAGEGRVGDAYELAEFTGTDGVSRVELTPVDPAASDFLSATISFVDGIPVELELVDGLENLTHVEFFDVSVNPGLDESQFDFTPPSGVTVVGDHD